VGEVEVMGRDRGEREGEGGEGHRERERERERERARERDRLRCPTSKWFSERQRLPSKNSRRARLVRGRPGRARGPLKGLPASTRSAGSWKWGETHSILTSEGWVRVVVPLLRDLALPSRGGESGLPFLGEAAL
jgi:hypothetical protein